MRIAQVLKVGCLSGDVQWMKTGGGIIHSEMPAMTEGKLHGFSTCG